MKKLNMQFSVKGLKWEFGREGKVRTDILIPRPKANSHDHRFVGVHHTISWIRAVPNADREDILDLWVYFIDDVGGNSCDDTREPDRRLRKAFGLSLDGLSGQEYIKVKVPLDHPDDFLESAIHAARTAMTALGVPEKTVRQTISYFEPELQCLAKHKGNWLPLAEVIRAKLHLHKPIPHFQII